MGEKRFTWKTEKLQHSDDEVLMVVDNTNKDWKGHILNIVDKLNEQQDVITEQKEKVARVLNEYSRQFKRHSKEFSFMLDLAEDLGVKSLEAKDD